MKNIGELIREQRKIKNLTQEELGKMVFVSKQAVSKWENSRTLPDIETLRMLSKVLDIKLENILSGSFEEAKRSRKCTKFLIVVAIISLLCAIFFAFGGLDFIEHRTQSGVTLLTVYENGALLAADDYSIHSDLPFKNAKNGYKFATGYGEIRGDVFVEDGYEIEYGFNNTNNWHNIQIRLDIENQNETLAVKQTVTYQTENNIIEVIITEQTIDSGQKISVFRDGV